MFKKLQELEFKRIMHFKTLFCDVAHTYEDLLPDIQKVGEAGYCSRGACDGAEHVMESKAKEELSWMAMGRCLCY